MWWAALLNSFTAILDSGGAGGGGGSYESIATATGTGSNSTITFSSIPSTYTSLQIRIIARDTISSGGDINLRYRINGDTGSNYTDHSLRADGSTASAGGLASYDLALVRNFVTESSGGNTTIYGVGIMDFIDYASTTKNKTVRTFAGKDKNGSGYIILGSNLWMSTAAVSSISFIADGTAFATGTTISLYGIKGA
jgi:hypothetical protein